MVRNDGPSDMFEGQSMAPRWTRTRRDGALTLPADRDGAIATDQSPADAPLFLASRFDPHRPEATRVMRGCAPAPRGREPDPVPCR
jgi:hypothetical protein